MVRTPAHLLDALLWGVIQPLRHILLRPSSHSSSSNQLQTLSWKPLLERSIIPYKKHKDENFNGTQFGKCQILYISLGQRANKYPRHSFFFFFLLLVMKATVVAQSLNRAASFLYASVLMLPKEALPVHWTAGAARLVQWKWPNPALRKSPWLIPSWSISSNFSSNLAVNTSINWAFPFEHKVNGHCLAQKSSEYYK